jgi:hypothetical protein
MFPFHSLNEALMVEGRPYALPEYLEEDANKNIAQAYQRDNENVQILRLRYGRPHVQDDTNIARIPVAVTVVHRLKNELNQLNQHDDAQNEQNEQNKQNEQQMKEYKNLSPWSLVQEMQFFDADGHPAAGELSFNDGVGLKSETGAFSGRMMFEHAALYANNATRGAMVDELSAWELEPLFNAARIDTICARGTQEGPDVCFVRMTTLNVFHVNLGLDLLPSWLCYGY